MLSGIRQVLSVFVASPSDVAVERETANRVGVRINRIVRDWGWQVDIRGWESIRPGQARPQDLINPDVDACDVFVGIIWKRWGEPNGRYSSGFEEEFERALARRAKDSSPQMLLYFRDIDEASRADPGPQLSQVLDFENRILKSNSMLFRQYGDEKEFEDALFEHLMRDLGERALAASTSRLTSSLPENDRSQLSSGLALTHRQPVIPPTSLNRLSSNALDTADQIAANWARSESSDNPFVVPSAYGPDGTYTFDPFRSGIALVGGTTGSGKSETIRTIASAAALSISPRLLQISFLRNWRTPLEWAIENRNGAQRRLDLSNDETALDTLVAEVRRREIAIGDLGIKDFEQLRSAPLALRLKNPYLLVCVDEIADLRFGPGQDVDDLISIAQISRSLGMRFVLGSQRFSGISSRLRANSTRTIGLGTMDFSDSMYMLDIPDAALIPRGEPGLAFVADYTEKPILVRFGFSGNESGDQLAELVYEATRLANFDGPTPE